MFDLTGPRANICAITLTLLSIVVCRFDTLINNILVAFTEKILNGKLHFLCSTFANFWETHLMFYVKYNIFFSVAFPNSQFLKLTLKFPDYHSREN